MTNFLEFLQTTPGIILLLGIGIVLILTMIFAQDPFKLTDWAYRLPLIGRLNRYSRDYSETKHGGWLNSEARLCHDYARHLSCMPPEEFRNHRKYLRKCYDAGRKPLPALVIALLAFLVFLEGLGFSYLLSTWMALEGSENTRTLLTFAIVTVLSAVLVWVTHSAGNQLYRTRLLRSCFQQFQTEGLHDREGRNRERSFTTHTVSLDQNQDIDLQSSEAVQCANRVATSPNDRGSYAWMWIAGGLIVAIAILSTVLRIETLYSQPSLAAGGVDAFGSAGQAGEGQTYAAEIAAISSFWILATIFVVTQLVGMGVGYRYGFAGRESETAVKLTRGCPDYETYFRPVRARMKVADARLTSLQAMMERRHGGAIDWNRDFFEFVREERDRGISDLQDPREVDSKNPRLHPEIEVQAERERAVEKVRKPNGKARTGEDTPPPPPSIDDDSAPRAAQ